jgi:hypothetical protein
MAEGTKETKTHVEGNNNVVDNFAGRELEMLSDKLTTAIFLAGKKDILIPSAAGALVLLTVILYFLF